MKVHDLAVSLCAHVFFTRRHFHLQKRLAGNASVEWTCSLAGCASNDTLNPRWVFGRFYWLRQSTLAQWINGDMDAKIFHAEYELPEQVYRV